jgi:hypothetical protein
MRTIVPSRLLKVALCADAAASGPIALLQLAAAPQLAELTGLPHALLVETGAFLVAYTVVLVVLALAPSVARALVLLIVAGNVAWGVAGVALLAGGTLAPSALGVAFVGLHVASVLAFAALEWAGLRRSAAAGRAGLAH